MSLQVEKLEKNMAKLTVEVPAEQFEKAIKKAFNKNKNRFNIPGFRKGKAPQAMIEKMYGVGVFYEDAADEAINADLRRGHERERAGDRFQTGHRRRADREGQALYLYRYRGCEAGSDAGRVQGH